MLTDSTNTELLKSYILITSHDCGREKFRSFFVFSLENTAIPVYLIREYFSVYDTLLLQGVL